MPSIIIYLLLFLSNLSLAQSNGQKDSSTILIEKECITRIIAADDSLGAIRNHDCEKVTLSRSIKNYVRSIKKLNFKNCPVGFKNVFYNHKDAWHEMLKITNKYPALRGEMHDLFDQLEKGKDSAACKKYLKQIWDTWAEIEKFIKPY
jgi:DNA phosphorothioation-dependent restriction protein DptG